MALKTKDPIELIEEIFYRIKSERNHFIKDYGITYPQYELLIICNENCGASIGKLKQESKEPGGDVSRKIQRLVDMGYLTKDVSLIDLRACQLFITKDGLELLEEITPHIEKLNALLLRGIQYHPHLETFTRHLTLVQDGFKK